jgi:hypothetical protein
VVYQDNMFGSFELEERELLDSRWSCHILNRDRRQLWWELASLI